METAHFVCHSRRLHGNMRVCVCVCVCVCVRVCVCACVRIVLQRCSFQEMNKVKVYGEGLTWR